MKYYLTHAPIMPFVGGAIQSGNPRTQREAFGQAFREAFPEAFRTIIGRIPTPFRNSLKVGWRFIALIPTPFRNSLINSSYIPTPFRNSLKKVISNLVNQNLTIPASRRANPTEH